MNFRERGYVGWALDAQQRDALLRQFPPRFPTIRAHHVTHLHDVTRHFVPYQQAGRIVGYKLDEQRGVEALVVAIDGSTVRYDGKTYHCTWSLDYDNGARSEHSNTVLFCGWVPIEPIDIILKPSFFYFEQAYDT